MAKPEIDAVRRRMFDALGETVPSGRASGWFPSWGGRSVPACGDAEHRPDAGDEDAKRPHREGSAAAERTRVPTDAPIRDLPADPIVPTTTTASARTPDLRRAGGADRAFRSTTFAAIANRPTGVLARGRVRYAPGERASRSSAPRIPS